MEKRKRKKIEKQKFEGNFAIHSNIIKKFVNKNRSSSLILHNYQFIKNYYKFFDNNTNIQNKDFVKPDEINFLSDGEYLKNTFIDTKFINFI